MHAEDAHLAALAVGFLSKYAAEVTYYHIGYVENMVHIFLQYLLSISYPGTH